MSGAETVVVTQGCPFCGDVGKVAHIVLPNGGWWAVECASNDCGCIGPSRQTEAEAIAAWNTRATQADTLAVMREAEGALEEAADALKYAPYRNTRTGQAEVSARTTLANLRAAIARMGGA